MELEDSYWLYCQRWLDVRGDLTKSRKLGRNELNVLFRRYERKIFTSETCITLTAQKKLPFCMSRGM